MLEWAVVIVVMLSIVLWGVSQRKKQKAEAEQTALAHRLELERLCGSTAAKLYVLWRIYGKLVTADGDSMYDVEAAGYINYIGKSEDRRDMLHDMAREMRPLLANGTLYDEATARQYGVMFTSTLF